MMDKLKYLYDQERIRLSALKDGRGDYSHSVFGEGDISADIMLIGEAPGSSEAESGRPFVGKAGKQLRQMIDTAEIDISRLFVTNSVKFRPWSVKQVGKKLSYKNRTPTSAEISDGTKLLEKEIECVSPNIIVTLGNTPIYSIERITGEKIGKIGEVHGMPYMSHILGIHVFPLYHPASGIYNRSLVPVMESDLKKLGRFITEL